MDTETTVVCLTHEYEFVQKSTEPEGLPELSLYMSDEEMERYLVMKINNVELVCMHCGTPMDDVVDEIINGISREKQ